MSLEGDIVVDWLKTIWGYLYWKIAVSKFGFWIISVLIKNLGTVDFVYCFNHWLIGILLFVRAIEDEFYVKPLLLFIALTIWFFRLGGFILITRIIPQKKDPRYEKMLEEAKSKFVYTFVQFQFQGIVVMFVASNLYFVFRRPDYTNLGTLIVGLILVAIGIIGEAISDRQLEEFKKLKKKGAILDTGLWKHSRHPNLFFELVVWVGFGLTGINENAIELLGFIAPFLLWCVMNFLTVPITEKHMASTRPQLFKDYCDRTNKFWPIPVISFLKPSKTLVNSQDTQSPKTENEPKP